MSMVQKCLPHDKFTFVPEATIPKILDAIHKAEQSSGDKEALHHAIKTIAWDTHQESPAEQTIAQGVQAMARIADCAVLPSHLKRPLPQPGDKNNKRGCTQPKENRRPKRHTGSEEDSTWVSEKCPKRQDLASPSPKLAQQPNQKQQQQPTPPKSTNTKSRRRNRDTDRPFFPSLTKPSSERYMSLMTRSQVTGSQQDDKTEAAADVKPASSGWAMLPIPDIGRQRPDGILINWKKRQLHILEFTRPYDSRRTSLAKSNLYKLLKYEPLSRKLSTALPAPWTTSVTAFAVGVRGTADEPAWSTALLHLGISRRHHDQIITAAIRSSLDAIYEMTETRHAALQLAHQPVDKGKASPARTRSPE